MVEVSMGQKYTIQSFGWKRKWFPVPYCELSFLIETAVHQKPGAASFNEVT
jgi:hypothetical protein